MSQFWKRVVATVLLTGIMFFIIQIGKSYGSETGGYLLMLLFLIPATNAYIRLYYWSKPFVSSRYNIFTAKYKRNLIIDLPPEIAYGKFIEVIEKSPLVLEKTKDSTLEIFAYQKASWLSIGDNLYINFEKAGNSSRMVVLLVSFKRFDEESSIKTLTDLIDQFENSLII